MEEEFAGEGVTELGELHGPPVRGDGSILSLRGSIQVSKVYHRVDGGEEGSVQPSSTLRDQLGYLADQPSACHPKSKIER